MSGSAAERSIPGDVAAGVALAEVDDRAPVKPNFQARIANALLVGFGGLVFLAVASVLALGLWSGRENTFRLLSDKSESTITLILARIDQHLTPAEHQLIHLGRQIESGRIDPSRDQDLGRHLSGALAATPHVRSVVFIHESARMVFALRSEDGVDLQVVDVSKMPVIREGLEAARHKSGLFWGEVVRPETADTTLINVRYPVRRDGRYLGLLAATVRIDRLSALLDSTARTLGGRAFVLYGADLVLAHPRLIDGFPGLDRKQPLPTVAQINDPVIQALLRPADPRDRQSRFVRETGIRIVNVGAQEVAVLSRRITRYGEIPWTAGVYFPAATVKDELARLQWAAAAGIAVLVVSLVVAYGYARYLSAPLNRLATAARQVRDLSLAGVQRLPSSLFTEISEAARAFNSMVVGLRWFETYVPRKLVQRLVQQGDAAVRASVSRVATVMFTDIVGFTGQSETMTAPETAAFLNDHFALLSGPIEAEGGTIDKFIGDAIMAFWGAPETQPDHAARACRAALAMREAIAADNGERRAAGKAPVRVRVGLHTGEVIVGNIGAPGRINYTIVGDTVNTANRIEALGKEIGLPDADVTIALSGATAGAAGSAVHARFAGSYRLRGRQDETDVYSL
jgi:class 3 adenylate cyclase